jgi:hypothetical protein
MHKKLFHFITALILLSGAVLAVEKPPKAERMPSPPTTQQRSLISEGVSLHDASQYDDAIAKYKQVLEEAPMLLKRSMSWDSPTFTKRITKTPLCMHEVELDINPNCFRIYIDH